MPMRKKGGNKGRRKTGAPTEEKLILRDEEGGEVYARVSAVCGSGRFMLKLVQYDEARTPILSPTDVMGILPGRMKFRRNKRKQFVSVNDYVLIQQRDFQTEQDKVDILHKYDSNSAKKLAKMRAVPDDVGEESQIYFGHEGDEDADGLGIGASTSGASTAGGGGSAAAEATAASGASAGAAQGGWKEGFDFDEI